MRPSRSDDHRREAPAPDGPHAGAAAPAPEEEHPVGYALFTDDASSLPDQEELEAEVRRIRRHRKEAGLPEDSFVCLTPYLQTRAAREYARRHGRVRSLWRRMRDPRFGAALRLAVRSGWWRLRGKT